MQGAPLRSECLGVQPARASVAEEDLTDVQTQVAENASEPGNSTGVHATGVGFEKSVLV